jgi:hypothetical protein
MRALVVVVLVVLGGCSPSCVVYQHQSQSGCACPEKGARDGR